MDPSPVLRQQSQNKIRSDFMRMKNEHNKMPVHPKHSKLLSATLCADQDIENKNPGNLEMGRKAPVRQGVSRLPVLAKSLRLQTPSEFSQSHCRWEEKPLAGKAKKPKSCTRPIPFNLSQPRSSKMATESQQPLTGSQSRTGTHAVTHDKNVHSVHLKTQNINTKPDKHPVPLNSSGDSSRGCGKSNGNATENTSQLSGQSGPSSTFKTSATLSHPLSSIPNNAINQNSTTPSAQAAFNADACLDNMTLLSLKDPTKTSHASQNMQAMRGNFSKSSTDKKGNFQPDHAAMLSVLRNEGSATGLGSATPQSKPYNDLPQRVSVMKSRQKAGPTTRSMKSVQFSPDAAALQSILQNEGVKAEGLVGGTPRNSIRQSGRGTSIYTAQRVPARKNRVEATGGPAAVALKETPLKEWLPQRVPNTRHQPMSAMKWHPSTPHTSSPGLRRCKANPKLHQEHEVVQRLFSDPEEEQNPNVTDKDPDTRAEQLPGQATTTKSHCEEKVETRRPSSDKDEGEEQRIVGVQPFFQAPERESVIFFSTGKKLLRAPRFEQQESSVHQEQLGSVLSEQRKVIPVHENTSVSGLTHQSNSSVQSLHRDFSVQKTRAQSAAVALLRKRLPPLEELRMDEEVAIYTSEPIPTTPGFVPPRPRCGNPLASILNFEESSRFVPIGCDESSDRCSPLSSPLQER